LPHREVWGRAVAAAACRSCGLAGVHSTESAQFSEQLVVAAAVVV
jgi:hypothetical protein